MLRRSAFAAVILSFSAPAPAQDAAEVVVRMNRLENQVRQMSGQIEQLQFENRQLKDQVRKFQEDVEFRFQDQRGGAPRAQAPAIQQPPAATQTPPSVQTRPQRRGDAFDPGEMPNAPGAPRPLGTTAPSAPLPPAQPPRTIGGLIESDYGPGSPLDLNQVRGTGAVPAP